mgnify:CR=1 FL=1
MIKNICAYRASLICQLIEVFEDGRYVHIVHAMVVGQPLFKYIATHGVDEDAAAMIARQAVRALSVAATAGVQQHFRIIKHLFQTH